jgi:hypothetical protein
MRPKRGGNEEARSQPMGKMGLKANMLGGALCFSSLVGSRILGKDGPFHGYNSDFRKKTGTVRKRKQEVLGRTNHLLSLIRHGPH